MKDLAVKGYATYDRLKTCIVGRTYSREQFGHIKNQKVKDVLFRILDETEEDYQNLCKLLGIAGVEVLRPDQIDGDISHRPANQPRDDMAVIGETLYVNNNRFKHVCIFSGSGVLHVSDFIEHACVEVCCVASIGFYRLASLADSKKPDWVLANAGLIHRGCVYS